MCWGEKSGLVKFNFLTKKHKCLYKQASITQYKYSSSKISAAPSFFFRGLSGLFNTWSKLHKDFVTKSPFNIRSIQRMIYFCHCFIFVTLYLKGPAVKYRSMVHFFINTLKDIK